MTKTIDKIAPKLLSSTPKASSSGVHVHQNVVLIFNEPIKVGYGSIVISDGTTVNKIALTSAQVKISGKTLTINHTKDFLPNSHYSVTVASTSIKDLAGNKYAGTTLNFDTVDTLAPTLKLANPQDKSMAVDVSKNIELTFDEAVKAGIGTVIISNGTDRRSISILDKSQVSFDAQTITINPKDALQPGSHYTVTASPSAIKDLAGNKYAGLTNKILLSFDTVKVSAPITPSPVVDTSTPSSAIVPTVPVDTLVKPPVVLPPVPVVDNLTPSAVIVSTVPTDIANDKTIPTLVSFTPKDDSVNVVKDSNIVLTFSEAIKAGSGYIILNGNGNNNDVRVIDVKDNTQVTINDKTITINPTVDLKTNNFYSVQINNGVIADLSNNNFLGINDSTTFNFRTEMGKPAMGKAIDGYLAGASVSITVDGKTYSTTTDASGNFSFPAGTPTGTIVASGGTDLTTGKPFLGVLKAPEGSTMITPLTALQNAFVEKGQSIDDAEKSVAKALDFDPNKVDLASYDPIQQVKDSKTGSVEDKSLASDLMASASKVANLLVAGAKTLQGASGGKLSLEHATDALMLSLVNSIDDSKNQSVTNGTGEVNLADPTFLKNVISGSSEQLDSSGLSGTDLSTLNNAINNVGDAFSKIMADSATNIDQAASKNALNPDAMLSAMGNVSEFTQENAAEKLSNAASTGDVLPASFSDNLTGDNADKAINQINAPEVIPQPIIETPPIPTTPSVALNESSSSDYSSYTAPPVSPILPAKPVFTLAPLTNNNVVNVSGINTGATWQYSMDNGSTWSKTLSNSVTSFPLKQSDVLTFDTLATDNNDNNPMPNGYGGLNWNGTAQIGVVDSGFQNSTPSSSDKVAFNYWGGTTSIDSIGQGTFNFTSADFTSAWDNQNISFEGWNGDTEVYVSNSYAINTTSPTNIALNWTGIDKLVINNDGSQWLMTNFSYNHASGNYASGTIQVKQIDAAGNVSSSATNATAVTVDAVAPTAAFSSPITFSNTDNTLQISFSEPIDGSKLTLDQLSIEPSSLDNSHSFGTGATLTANGATGFASSFTLTLGTSSTVVSGDQFTVNEGAAIDLAGNSNSSISPILFTVPATLTSVTPSAPTLTFPSVMSSNTVNVSGINTGATWQYSMDNGSTWSKTLSDSVTSFPLKQSDVLTFDTLATDNNDNNPMPNGYGGLNWNGTAQIGVVDSGFQNGTPSSSDKVAFNYWGGTTSIDSIGQGTFDFTSAYFTSAWDNQNISFEGWNGDIEVYVSNSYAINTTSPTNIALDWTGIDKLVINNDGSQWLMDNFSYNHASGNYASGAIQVKQTDAAGNVSSLAKNATAVTVDTVAPTAALLSPITFSNADNTLQISFSEPIDGSKLTLDQLSIEPSSLDNSHSFGTGATLLTANGATNGFASSFTLTLGDSPTIVSGDQFTVNEGAAIDLAGNINSSYILFNI